MAFDLDALGKLLVCPKCKSPLIQDGETLVCAGADCRLAYEIRDDIPILLVDEARPLDPDEWSALQQKSV